MFGWLKKNKRKKGKDSEMSSASLSALIRGIHHAVSSTHAMLAEQYMHMLKQFFDEREGKLFAKMTYVQMDDRHWVPLPLISLVQPSGFTLERMKVSMSVRIDEVKSKQATIDGDGSTADRLSFSISISPKSKKGKADDTKERNTDITDIEMEFQAGSPPEALMRLIDNFTNLIDPRDFEKVQPPMDRYPPTQIGFIKGKHEAQDGTTQDDTKGSLSQTDSNK